MLKFLAAVSLFLAACSTDGVGQDPVAEVHVVATLAATTTYDDCDAPGISMIELYSDGTALVTTDIGVTPTSWADEGGWWLFPDLNIEQWKNQRWEANPISVTIDDALDADLNWHSQNGPRCIGKLVLTRI